MEILIKNKQNKILIIIPYDENVHNKECQKLEQNSGKESMFFGIIQTQRNLKLNYKNMLTQKHINGFILVVKDKDLNVLAAKVCVGIKDVIIKKQKQKTCYIYDLRVDKSYQRLGIGQQLITYIEQYAQKQYQVTMSFCSISCDNAKSLNLFKKLGYNQELSSERCIKFGYIDKQYCTKTNDYLIKQQQQFIYNTRLFIEEQLNDNTQIKNLLNQYYKDIDLFPINYDDLINHPNSIGFFTVKEKETQNIAAAHLFLDNQKLSLTLKRLIFKVQDYQNWYVKLFFLGILFLITLLISQYVLFYVLKLFLENFISENIIKYICYFTLLIFNYYASKKILKFVKIISKISGPHIRISSLMYLGDQNKKEIMVLQLYNYISQIALEQGCNFVKYNMERRSQFWDISNHKQTPFMYTKNKTQTELVYKILDKEKQEGYKNYKLGSETFFDPRDV